MIAFPPSLPLEKCLVRLELEGALFDYKPEPWLHWMVKHLSRIEVHNYPMVTKMYLRASMPLSMIDFVVQGAVWKPYTDEYDLVRAGFCYGAVNVMAQYRTDSSAQLLQPALSTLRGFFNSVVMTHMVVVKGA